MFKIRRITTLNFSNLCTLAYDYSINMCIFLDQGKDECILTANKLFIKNRQQTENSTADDKKMTIYFQKQPKK